MSFSAQLSDGYHSTFDPDDLPSDSDSDNNTDPFEEDDDELIDDEDQEEEDSDSSPTKFHSPRPQTRRSSQNRRGASSKRSKSSSKNSASSKKKARSKARKVSPQTAILRTNEEFSDQNNRNSDQDDSESDDNNNKMAKTRPRKMTPAEKKLADELAKMKAQLKASQAKCTQLETAPRVIVRVKARSGRTAKQDQSDGTIILIKDFVKFWLWSKVKFIVDHNQLARVSRIAYSQFDLKDKKSPGHMEGWIEVYGPVIQHELGEHRSYIQNRLRVAAFSWMRDHEGNLPAVGTIYACANRKVSMTIAAQKEVFVWYVDEFLPKATGIPGAFDEKVRYYMPISEAHPLNKPKEPSVTPSTEAIAAVLFDNCRVKWMEFYKLKQKYGNKAIITKKHKPEGAEEPTITPKNIIVYDKKYKGKYTVADGGQNKFGGFKVEGLSKFMDAKISNKEARAEPENVAKEVAVMAELRERNDITAESYDAENGASGVKRKEVLVVDKHGDAIKATDMWEDLGDESQDEENAAKSTESDEETEGEPAAGDAE